MSLKNIKPTERVKSAILLVLLAVVLLVLFIRLRAIRTPEIHKAAEEGNLTKVKTILARHPDQINAKDRDDWTALHRALNANQSKVAEFLIMQGADVNVKTHERKNWSDAINDYGWTPLHMAANAGNKKLVELLIDNQAEVNAKTKQGYTPLHMAVIDGYKETVKILIANGADVNIENTLGQTPLTFAIIKEHSDIVEYLQKHAAEK